MMKVEALSTDKKQKKLSFIIKDINPAWANAIRRAAIEEVPVMAIEDVEFKNNSSVLYDEMVALRLGLIPLTTDLKSYNLPEKCKCEGKGCAQCQLKLSLRVRSKGMVYASEITSTDPKVKPALPTMPIVKLRKGQRLEFDATAILGRGRQHAKWSPGLVYYKHIPIIEVKKNCTNAAEVIEQCPQGIFELKNGTLAVNKERVLSCHLCNACVENCEPAGAVTVDKNENDFVFTVESWGQLEPQDMIEEALDILKDTAKEFTKEIKKEAKAS